MKLSALVVGDPLGVVAGECPRGLAEDVVPATTVDRVFAGLGIEPGVGDDDPCPGRFLADLASCGHLGAFVGMLTDSRSFLSYPRHHYFRRILCNYFGTMIENGQMTSDLDLVGKVVEDISFNNSWAYFGLK